MYCNTLTTSDTNFAALLGPFYYQELIGMQDWHNFSPSKRYPWKWLSYAHDRIDIITHKHKVGMHLGPRYTILITVHT